MTCHLYLRSNFFFSYQGHKFPDGPTVFHYSLYVDSLTIGKHLVTQAIDRTIPDRREIVGGKETIKSWPLWFIFFRNNNIIIDAKVQLQESVIGTKGCTTNHLNITDTFKCWDDNFKGLNTKASCWRRPGSICTSAGDSETTSSQLKVLINFTERISCVSIASWFWNCTRKDLKKKL